jgi:hypothetical protein
VLAAVVAWERPLSRARRLRVTVASTVLGTAVWTAAGLPDDRPAGAGPDLLPAECVVVLRHGSPRTNAIPSRHAVGAVVGVRAHVALVGWRAVMALT